MENHRQQDSNVSNVDTDIQALFAPGKLTNPLDSLRGGTKTLLKTFLQTSRFCLRLPLYVFRLACLVPRATHTWTLLETKILINPLVSLLGGPRALSISNCFSSSIKYESSGSLFATSQEVRVHTENNETGIQFPSLQLRIHNLLQNNKQKSSNVSKVDPVPFARP